MPLASHSLPARARAACSGRMPAGAADRCMKAWRVSIIDWLAGVGAYGTGTGINFGRFFLADFAQALQELRIQLREFPPSRAAVVTRCEREPDLILALSQSTLLERQFSGLGRMKSLDDSSMAKPGDHFVIQHRAK